MNNGVKVTAHISRWVTPSPAMPLYVRGHGLPLLTHLHSCDSLLHYHHNVQSALCTRALGRFNSTVEISQCSVVALFPSFPPSLLCSVFLCWPSASLCLSHHLTRGSSGNHSSHHQLNSATVISLPLPVSSPRQPRACLPLIVVFIEATSHPSALSVSFFRS